MDERYAAQALPMGCLRTVNVTQAARSFFNMTHQSPDRGQLFWNRSRWLAKLTAHSKSCCSSVSSSPTVPAAPDSDLLCENPRSRPSDMAETMIVVGFSIADFGSATPAAHTLQSNALAGVR